MDITVIMKNGEVREFPHRGRAGGSYTKSIEYQPGFVVIKDEWYNTTAIPTSEIAEVKTRQ